MRLDRESPIGVRIDGSDQRTLLLLRVDAASSKNPVALAHQRIKYWEAPVPQFRDEDISHRSWYAAVLELKSMVNFLR